MTRTIRTLVATLAALGLAAPALAVLPAPQESGEVTYLTGGVGDAEQREIEAKADEYKLQLTIAKPNGAYLAKARIRIEKPDGTKVLETTARGPVLLADLADGRYVIHASLDGHESEQRTVDVSGKDPTRMVVTLAEKEKMASKSGM